MINASGRFTVAGTLEPRQLCGGPHITYAVFATNGATSVVVQLQVKIAGPEGQWEPQGTNLTAPTRNTVDAIPGAEYRLNVSAATFGTGITVGLIG